MTDTKQAAHTRFEIFEEASKKGEHMDDIECWRFVAATLQAERDRLRADRDALVEALESTVDSLHEQVTYLKEALEQYAMIVGAKGQIARTALKLYALPLSQQRREMSLASRAEPCDHEGGL